MLMRWERFEILVSNDLEEKLHNICFGTPRPSHYSW